jgi:REP element-mobilizing transposase RayT
MGSTLSHLIYHVLFSTKDRFPLPTREKVDHIGRYMTGILKMHAAESIVIGGGSDHYHLVFVLRPGDRLADIVREVKAGSSKWANEEQLIEGKFAWQSGYSAFTVSKSQLPALIKYVQEQEEHHRTVTFQEELVLFLRKHGVAYDERYIWG